MPDHQNTLVIICGPTAVGKTTTAIQLAQHFNTQIISADSRQCYNELNIGVAKPSQAELNTIPHYFINSHSIGQDVNARVFENYALASASTIFKNNNIAIMVGGTGLYIKSVVDGLDDIPESSLVIRQEINNNYNLQGLAWLQQQVQQQDPEFWQIAEKNNPHRLMRALEVKQSTGKSILHFRQKAKVDRPFNILQIGLELPKDLLHQQMNKRVDVMMENGLLNEVTGLQSSRHLKALQTVGYAELFKYLDGNITLEKAVEDIKTNTRQYAKRQMTWFKRDGRITWHTYTNSVADKILQFIKNNTHV